MVKKIILKISKETGVSPYGVMEAFIYGALGALVMALSIYPACWVLVKIAEMTGRI